MPPTPAIASIPVGTIDPTPDDRPDPARRAAYRRLAMTILGLDVPTLVAELQAAARPSHARQPGSPSPAPRRLSSVDQPTWWLAPTPLPRQRRPCRWARSAPGTERRSPRSVVAVLREIRLGNSSTRQAIHIRAISHWWTVNRRAAGGAARPPRRPAPRPVCAPCWDASHPRFRCGQR